MVFGELVGGKNYSRGQEKHWMTHLNEDLSVLGWNSKGGERLLRSPADGSDEYGREPSCSCGIA